MICQLIGRAAVSGFRAPKIGELGALAFGITMLNKVRQQRWRPLSARESDEAIDDTLFEGVPDHLERLFREWLIDSTQPATRRRIAAMTRTADLPSDMPSFTRWLADYCPTDLLLDLVDAVLYAGPEPGGLRSPFEAISELRTLLLDGGSAYSVKPDFLPAQHCRLERRVAAETAEVARSAIAKATTTASAPSAATHLAAAWKAVYGLHPNPALAYSEAVKAVEAALIPVVQPNHGRATLGTVLGELRANSDRWQIAIDHGPNHTGDIRPFVAMAEALWTGQTDRHATNGPTRSVSQTAAEGAVFLAATLVQWAQAGVFSKA